MSLYEKMRDYAERNTLRLHTPGHKGRIAELDLTELTDGSFPNAEIENAQADIARIYGAKHARLLCGGSSQGVKSAIYFADRAAIVDINSHRSVRDGFKLCGKKYIEVGEKGGMRPMTVKDIDAAMTFDTGAVVVTSPTYYGFVADIDGISEYCRRKGLLFIVDGAHGAHFGFSKSLPRVFAGRCDICNLSTHKTLASLTQSAVLLDNLSETDGARLGAAADIMGTTSPSYLLYASIEYAVKRAAERQTSEAYEKLVAPLAEIRKSLPIVDNDDFTRIVLDCASLNVSASALNAALCEAGVYSEMIDARHIVFIFTAANTPNDVERLRAAIARAVKEIG